MSPSSFPLLRLAADGTIVQANEAARTRGLGDRLLDSVALPDRPALAAALVTACAAPCEVPVRLGGAQYQMLLQPSDDARHVDAVLVPPTRPHASEAFAAFAARSPVCLAHLDAQGTVTFESQRARQLLGYSSLGTSFLSSDPELDRAVDALLAGGSPFNSVPFTTDVRGQQVRLLGYGSAVRSAEGAVVGAVVVAVAPEKMEGLPQQMRADPKRGDFVSTVTHEVRNPLGVVNGFASMLADELEEFAAAAGAEIPAPVLEFVETIQLNARRALDILADLSDLAKLEAGALTVRHEPVQMGELVQRVGKAFGSGREERWTLSVGVDAPDAVAVGDAHRIEQILNALLTRAADAGEQASLRLTTLAGRVAVEVEADGRLSQPGRPDELPPDPAARYRKAGRDLAIARGLAEAMGGTLTDTARPGTRRVFTLTLPEYAAS